MLSPQTIFLSDEFKARTLLIPFFPGAESSKADTLPALGTVAKSVLPFLAPELVRKTEKTTASDVFSFGLVLWHLFKPSNVAYPGKPLVSNRSRPLFLFSLSSSLSPSAPPISLCLSFLAHGHTCAHNPSLARRFNHAYARFLSSVPKPNLRAPSFQFLFVSFLFPHTAINL